MRPSARGRRRIPPCGRATCARRGLPEACNRLSSADRGAHLEDLAHSQGWDAVIADRVTIDDALEARRALGRLAELPARERQDLSLRVAGFSYREIAQITGCRTYTNVISGRGVVDVGVVPWLLVATCRWMWPRGGLFDVAGVAERVEQVAGGKDVKTGGGEVFVLGPDGQSECERERDGWPVVGVAGSDSPLGLLAPSGVSAVALQSTGMTCSAAKSSAGSRRRCFASRGRWRVISTATASAAMQRGPCGEAITSRARPPISAERIALASATTAVGSEIVEHLLLARALLSQLGADLLGEAQEHFTANLDRELGRVPGQEEAGGGAVAGDEDDVVGAEHLACAVAEIANGHDLHVGTSVVTHGW